MGFGVWSLGFGVWDSGLRFAGSGFSAWGSGLRVQDSGFRVSGFGFRVQGLGCRVWGSGCRVQGSGSRAQGLGFWVQVSGFRVQGSGFRVGVNRRGGGIRRAPRPGATPGCPPPAPASRAVSGCMVRHTASQVVRLRMRSVLRKIHSHVRKCIDQLLVAERQFRATPRASAWRDSRVPTTCRAMCLRQPCAVHVALESRYD